MPLTGQAQAIDFVKINKECYCGYRVNRYFPLQCVFSYDFVEWNGMD